MSLRDAALRASMNSVTKALASRAAAAGVGCVALTLTKSAPVDLHLRRPISRLVGIALEAQPRPRPAPRPCATAAASPGSGCCDPGRCRCRCRTAPCPAASPARRRRSRPCIPSASGRSRGRFRPSRKATISTIIHQRERIGSMYRRTSVLSVRLQNLHARSCAAFQAFRPPRPRQTHCNRSERDKRVFLSSVQPNSVAVRQWLGYAPEQEIRISQ